jgi:hypothetical protein
MTADFPRGSCPKEDWPDSSGCATLITPTGMSSLSAAEEAFLASELSLSLA